MAQQAPEKLSDFLDEIKEKYDQLSKRLRQVAEFILQSPGDVAFGTVATLSKNSGVHPSTWVRFANTFGFSGFSEMQKLFQTRLMQDTPNYQERVRHIKDQFDELPSALSVSTLLSQFAQSNALALDHLVESIEDTDLQAAIQILSKANSVHIIGARRSFIVASYFAYALRHSDQKAYLIDGAGGMYEEQASNFDEKDALIAVSFHPYALETHTVAMAAVKKGGPLIVITDNPVNQLASLASVSFVVKEAETHQFRSLSSSLVLAQTLSIALAYELESQK
ncbi:MurR/RpiR family transcriptional regulator [Marinomonas sp. 2405UD68-3]|uniref:MurR/RpiR family transcriptional regulator n=1 Tax=Marinomonas sp. 2405UD68-3 TaxID=3391835 RepID=UPI0039C95333